MNQYLTKAFYAISGGRYDLDWDARSDFNADGEKALYIGALYDFSKHNLPGWQAGSAYVYAWNAKPSSDPQFDQSRRLKESALTIDIFYTIQEGRTKDTQFQLHYTRYKNHSDIPTYKGGYANIFQSEKEINFTITAPFTLF